MSTDLDFKYRAAAKTIALIARDPTGITLDTYVPGALDLGRECTVAEGLHLGSDIQEDISDSVPIREVFGALNVKPPDTGLMGDYCKALIVILHHR